MPAKRILATLLHVTRTVIESARLEDGRLVVACRPRRGQEDLCPHCGRHRPVYDRSPSPRRWRALDLGATMAWIEYATLRVSCPEHGVVTAAVPWARPGSRFTEAFEDQVAWLCAHCGRSAVAELMRIDWKSVGGVCARVRERLEAASGDRLDGLARIGVDETSYKKGHKYMTVVVDHDTGRVAWCARGCGKEVLGAFFDLLGEERCAAVEVVTADGAGWIADVVEARCPNAERVMDPFHVVQWATDMLDSLRREAWGEARRAQAAARGRGGKGAAAEAAARARAVKGSRYALLKSPEDLTAGQESDLARVERENRPLWRAYLYKEGLRAVFKAGSGEEARRLLESWLASACHSHTRAVRELSRKVRRRKDAIVRAVELGMSNARIEAVNNKIKLAVRMAYGFRNFDNLAALVMLRCSNLPIALPGRT